MTDIRLFMEKIKLPGEAQEEFLKQMDTLTANNAGTCLDDIAKDFFQHKSRDYYLASLEKVHQLAETFQISPYTMDFLYMMTCGEQLLAEYRADSGRLTEDIFWDSMYDLNCKLYECRERYQIWGTFVARWYHSFWAKKIVKLGRLEYEQTVFSADIYQKGAIRLSKGDPVCTIHIPSEGPLRKDDVMDSLKQAYRFFGYRDHVPAPFVCHSWLLYKPNESIFPAGSNLLKFYEMFDIIESHEDEQFADCWRVFGTTLGPDARTLKQTSTLQKNIVNWLLSGRHMGVGYGVLLFDGQQLCR